MNKQPYFRTHVIRTHGGKRRSLTRLVHTTRPVRANSQVGHTVTLKLEKGYVLPLSFLLKTIQISHFTKKKHPSFFMAQKAVT